MDNNSPGNQLGTTSRSTAELDLSRAPKFTGTDSMPMEWTDEKHSLYLKSIEASFVNQLYDSLDCHQQHRQSPSSSKTLFKPNCSPSGQFKVLRDGFWHEVNFSRPRLQRNQADECHCFLASPWIKHFKSVNSLQGETASLKNNGKMSCAPAADIHKRSQCWPYAKFDGGNSDSAVEVSDQNFVNEDEEGEFSGESSTNGAKRMKTVKGGTSNADQVVPFDGPRLNDVPKNSASPGG
ncbi:hypothetical protein SAY87_011992 [Trapa incisa]|uniref:Cold regulated protein 27 n=1 Tax=Trapa incisa TaxID=236973 RepID=A0AAN7GMR9_9MYRT|nr:hypothetical protein SAY87_011992 [Trapa incisa]